MIYAIGQNICLWQVRQEFGSAELCVLKEVIVTITEIKTGAPGEFSGNPVSSQSLRGIGDDGKIYEKHWNSWPESQTRDFVDQWSIRDDGEGIQRFWIPKEAIHVYDAASCRKGPSEFILINQSGAAIKPKGDVVYCEEHDRYSYKDNTCFWCYAAMLDVASPSAV